MESISLSVRCTREEYMQFYATYRRAPAWTTALGVIVTVVAVGLCILDAAVQSHTLLLGLAGVLLLLLNPLLLPMARKGEAARRYDADDGLQDAVAMMIDDQMLTLRSTTVQGQVPLSSLTAVHQTAAMTVLEFGNELTVCIPLRSLNEQEQQYLQERLAPLRKG